MPSPTKGRPSSRRQASVRCTLRTKSTPRGTLAKGVTLTRNHGNELKEILHKRALRCSNSPPDCDVPLKVDPPDKNRGDPEGLLTGGDVQRNTAEDLVKSTTSDDTKENRKQPPKLRPKPDVKSKIYQKELTLAFDPGDRNRSVTEIKEQWNKLLSPVVDHSTPSLSALKRKSTGELLVAEINSQDKTSNPGSNRWSKSESDSDRRNSRTVASELTIQQENRSPSPRTKTAGLKAMFENKGQGSTMDQPKRVVSPKTATPGQKPVVPNKPKPKVTKPPPVNSLPMTPKSETSASAKPAIPRKSIDSSKLAELRKSLSGGAPSVPKPVIPSKPQVATKPIVEKDNVKNRLSQSPQRTVSLLPDNLTDSSSEFDLDNLGTHHSSDALLESSILIAPKISDAGVQKQKRLSNASTGSNTFDDGTNIPQSANSQIGIPLRRTMSNTSDGSSKIPAELMEDTTNFSRASRFVATPWKVSPDPSEDIDFQDTEVYEEYDDHVYGDIWSCTSFEPGASERRTSYDDDEIEYYDITVANNNGEGYKKVFKKICKLVRNLKTMSTHSDSEWKDCDSDKFNPNSLVTSRPLKTKVPSGHGKTLSLRRNALHPRRTNRPPSYEEVYLPGEESDSDGWMTDSEEDCDEDYEAFESEDDLDKPKDSQGHQTDQGESGQMEGQTRSNGPVAPARRKSLEAKDGRTKADISCSRSSDGELNGSRSSQEIKSGVQKGGPPVSPKTPMAAVLGQLHQAMRNLPKNLSRNTYKDSNDNGSKSKIKIDVTSSANDVNPNSNPSSPEMAKLNRDSRRPSKDSRLSLSHLPTSLSASPSSVSASSVSSTSSTSSSSSLSTPAPTRPAPKPPSHLLRKRNSQGYVSHQSDAEDGIPSSGYSSDVDHRPVVGTPQSCDSPKVLSSSNVTSSVSKEKQEAPELPPTLPPRKKRLSQPMVDTTQVPDEPPALPPPRLKWPKPVNPQTVSTSKDAMFPRSRSPEKIYQGQAGQGEGQTIPDLNSNVQNAEDFVSSFIKVNEDRQDGFEEDFEVEEGLQSKASRGSSVDSEGGNYLTLLDEVPLEEDGRSPFVNEPLYQIYHCGVVAMNVWESSKEFDAEEDPDSLLLDTSTLGEGEIQSVCGTLERMAKGQNASESELHATLQTLARSSHNFRTLWCEMPAVQKLGILESMTPKEKKFQESLFEVITSEASYLKSLSIFLAFFVDRPGIKGPSAVISDTDRKELFSNIAMIKDVSKRFMHDVENRWKQDPMLTIDLCEIIIDYAEGDFNAYVNYCANLVFQERKLRKLRETNERFQQLVIEFEARPECKSLPINTFLTLPMQRITRLPLLVDAICQRTDPETPEYTLTRKALLQLQKLVRTCNERARQIANIEQNTEIDRSLDFKKMKKMPIVSQSKCLVKKGKLTRIFRESKGFLGNKRKESLYLFLFNDLLIIAKKKNTNPSNETRSFQVVDYASRNAVEATVIDGINFTKWLPNGAPSGCQNLFVLALVDNHEHRHAEFYFACESLSDRTRWVEAMTPVSQVEDERIYEEWDCPQVQVIHRYVARQPDELTLEESDVINVSRKIPDGWYEGERIRDGERGWFPANHTVEIQSSHVRTRNLKQRYRLLTISEHFLLNTSGGSANISSKA